MKREEWLRHLREHGCEMLREGGWHSWWHIHLGTGDHPYRDIEKSMNKVIPPHERKG